MINDDNDENMNDGNYGENTMRNDDTFDEMRDDILNDALDDFSDDVLDEIVDGMTDDLMDDTLEDDMMDECVRDEIKDVDPVPDVRAPEVPGWRIQPSTSGRPSLEAIVNLQTLNDCASSPLALLDCANTSADIGHAWVRRLLDGLDDFLVCCELDDSLSLRFLIPGF